MKEARTFLMRWRLAKADRKDAKRRDEILNEEKAEHSWLKRCEVMAWCYREDRIKDKARRMDEEVQASKLRLQELDAEYRGLQNAERDRDFVRITEGL